MSNVSAFAAIADPTRRRLLDRLVVRPCSVAELTRGERMSQPAISQHLKVLREAGLVRGTPRGARTIYSVDPAGLGPIRAWLDQVWAAQLAAFAAAAAEVKDSADEPRHPEAN